MKHAFWWWLSLCACVLYPRLDAAAQDAPAEEPALVDETPAENAQPASAPQEAAAPVTAQSEQASTSSESPSETWRGPRVALSYRVYSLRDSQGGRTVNTAGFSGFLPLRYVYAGGGVEAGGRSYEYGSSEGLLSANLFAGYQHLGDLGRVVPYVTALGELGVLFGKRFHTPGSHALRGAGVELGANVNLVKSLWVGLGVSFMVYTIEGLSYDTFGLRLSIGL